MYRHAGILMLVACAEPAGEDGLTDADGDGLAAQHDCDDGDPAIHLDAEEICDGIDNNCDGLTDDLPIFGFYEDLDGDGFGAPDSYFETCDGSLSDVTTQPWDCDDTSPAVYPGHEEICDGLDNNCDGRIDDLPLFGFYEDLDGDGFGAPDSYFETCEEDLGDMTIQPGDCDDTDPAVHPEAEEVHCDGIDNNCLDEPGSLSWTTAEETTDLTAELADASPDAPASLTFTDPGTLSFCEGVFPVHLALEADVDVVGLFGAAVTTLESRSSPSVEITSPGAVSLVEVSLQNGSEQLVCSAGASVSMSDVVLIGNGYNLGVSLTDGCSLDLERAWIEGHSRGLLLMDSSAELRDSTLQGHSRAIVAVSSTLTGSGLTLRDNLSSNQSGAAIDLTDSDMVLSDAVLERNEAIFGGAISLVESTLQISGSSLLDNHTSNNGGAIYVSPLSHLDITDSLLESNQSSRGGAVYFEIESTGSGSALDFISNTPDDVAVRFESLTLGKDADFTIE